MAEREAYGLDQAREGFLRETQAERAELDRMWAELRQAQELLDYDRRNLGVPFSNSRFSYLSYKAERSFLQSAV